MASIAETVVHVFAHVAQASKSAHTKDAAETQAITEAMVRLFVRAPLRSDGQLTVKSLAEEAGLKRNKLTHKHTDLKDLFYALVKSQQEPPRQLSDREREQVRETATALKRVREERDTLKATAQQLARVIQVLTEENRQLAEEKEALEQQLAAHLGVTELSGRLPRRRR